MKRATPRAHRRAKEAALLALDLVTAHEEVRPARVHLVTELGTEHDPVGSFLDWFEQDCPALAAAMRAVPSATIASTLAAWKHPRGQSARRSTHEATKMGAVADLLGAIGVECKASSLAVLWARLCAEGRPTWRSDEWFLSWGVKARASVKG